MWKHGPMPPDTYGFGAVKLIGYPGFYYADFHGDHVIVFPGEQRITPPVNIDQYDNSLTEPPGCVGLGRG